MSWGGTPVTGTLAGVSVYTYKESVSFPVPEADKIGTDFIQKAMARKYTIRSIDFVSTRTKSLNGINESEKGSLGLSVDISKLMSKESFGEISAEYEQTFQRAFVFHVELGKKYLLVESLKKLIEDYSARLEKLQVEYKGKTYQITEEVVTDWMKLWMGFINTALDEHFRILERRMGSL